MFHSDRSGSLEIWVCDPGGQNLLQWTSIGGRLTGSPRWAPDSPHVAFDSRTAVSAASLEQARLAVRDAREQSMNNLRPNTSKH